MARMLLLALVLAPVLALAAAEIPIALPSEYAALDEAARTAAANERFTPTRVQLPSGPLALSDAVACLATAGNRVALATGVDATASIDFPGYTGDFWDGVLQVCEWYALAPLPSQETASEHWWQDRERGAPIPVQSGDCILGAKDGPAPAIRAACGALLVEAYELSSVRPGDGSEATLDIALRLRAEPRFAAQALGDVRGDWSQALVDGVATDIASRADQANRAGRLHLDGIVPQTPLVSLRGVARLRLSEPLHLEADLAPGDTGVINLGASQARILLLDRDQAREAGKRAACAAFTFPSRLLEMPAEIKIQDGDSSLPSNGSASRHDFDGDSEYTAYFAGLGVGVHHVTVDTVLGIAELEIPLAIDLDLGALPKSSNHERDPRPEEASRITLPAGDLSLADALRLLRHGDNEVLVDLGVDSTLTRTLPALEGTFWEACLAVALAFDLDILPPTSADGAQDAAPSAIHRRMVVMQQRSDANGAGQIPIQLTGGPVRLGRGKSDLPPADRLHACGPILVEITERRILDVSTLSGAERSLAVRLRLRLEPRVPKDQVDGASLWWASVAKLAAGGTLPVRPARTTDNEEVTPGQGLTLVTVEGIPAGSALLQLDGLVGFRFIAPQRATLTLQPGVSGVATLGPVPVTVDLGLGKDGENGSLTLTYTQGIIERIEATVIDADGQTLDVRGRSTHGRNQRLVEQLHLPPLTAGANYQVVLVTERTLSQPCLPLTVPVRLP